MRPNTWLDQMANKLGEFCKAGCRHWSAITLGRNKYYEEEA